LAVGTEAVGNPQATEVSCQGQQWAKERKLYI